MFAPRLSIIGPIAPTLFFSQADNEPTRSIGEACCIRALPQKGR